MSRVMNFDISADDIARAIAFYKSAFGWKIRKAPGALDYWMVRTGETNEPGIDGAIMQRDADWQRITMHIAVGSLDEAARKVEKAGGKIIRQRRVIPGVGFVACCQDTEGNVFAIFEQCETAGF